MGASCGLTRLTPLTTWSEHPSVSRTRIYAAASVRRWCSYSSGGRYPIEECNRSRLYQTNHSNMDVRASSFVL
jgi:hypothetical protein